MKDVKDSHWNSHIEKDKIVKKHRAAAIK